MISQLLRAEVLKMKQKTLSENERLRVKKQKQSQSVREREKYCPVYFAIFLSLNRGSLGE